jgi:hypothetical protein
MANRRSEGRLYRMGFRRQCRDGIQAICMGGPVAYVRRTNFGTISSHVQK